MLLAISRNDMIKAAVVNNLRVLRIRPSSSEAILGAKAPCAPRDVDLLQLHHSVRGPTHERHHDYPCFQTLKDRVLAWGIEKEC